MKSTIWKCITKIPLLAMLAIPTELPAQQTPNNEQPRFAVIDLGTLGGSFSIAVGINNKSWITGDANVLGDTARHGFLRQHGPNIDLGTLGGSNSRSQAVNQLGQVVGAAESFLNDDLSEGFCGFGTSSRCVPFIWQNEAMDPLTTLGGSNGIAFGINNRGLIAGVAENFDMRRPRAPVQAGHLERREHPAIAHCAG